jgi:kynurenine 3-monooxygenase
VRYSEALERGNKQQLIMDEIMQLEKIQELWDSETVEKMMLDKILKSN